MGDLHCERSTPNPQNDMKHTQQTEKLDGISKDGPFKGFSERYVRATYAVLAENGYRIMHCRNGQFWLMVERPMTFAEIDDFVWNASPIDMNGMGGHLEFTPIHRRQINDAANFISNS